MLDANGALGDLVWETSRHGTKGWQTGMAGARASTRMMTWGDSTPAYMKYVADADWSPLLVPGRAPADLFGHDTDNPTLPNAYPGSVQSCWDARFGGQSDTRIFMAQQGRVIRSDDGINFVNTGIIDMPVFPNNGSQRAYGPHGATDPDNPDVYYIGMGQYGFHYLLDGTTKISPSWCPAPNAPSDLGARASIIAVDEIGPVTGGANSRRARVAVCPSGRGVWLSLDGGETGSNITGSSEVESVSNAVWIGGKLYVCAVDKESGYGTGPDNIKIYDPANGTWTTLAHGITNNNEAFQFIIPDTPAGPAFTAFRSGFIRTLNGTTFNRWDGIGGQFPNKSHPFCRTKPRFRPLVAKSYRYEALGGAISTGIIQDGFIYIPIGFGILRTPLATFPTADGEYFTPSNSPNWPEWEEDCAGVEEIIGQNCGWVVTPSGKIEFWTGGQDAALVRWEDGRRGHLASVYKFPQERSDVHDIQQGSVPGWAMARRTRADNGLDDRGITYTVDGQTWQRVAVDPAKSPAATYECGSCAAGPLGEMVVIPSRYGALPSGSRDFGATPWTEMNFWIGGTQLDMSRWKAQAVIWAPNTTYPLHTVVRATFSPDYEFTVTTAGTTGATEPNWPNPYNDTNTATSGTVTFVAGRPFYHGFQGAGFSVQQHLVVHDNAHPGTYYIVNLGGGTSQTTAGSRWSDDPFGWAGIYKMSPGDWPNFRRVYAGQVTPYGNYGGFGFQMACDGQGHLVMMSNYVPGAAGDNGASLRCVVFNTDTNTLTRPASPFNLAGLSFGAPYPGDTNPCLWTVGWAMGGEYGLFYSRDLLATPPKGPFALPSGGNVGYIAAHPTEWGVIGAARKPPGHAIGRFQLSTPS